VGDLAEQSSPTPKLRGRAAVPLERRVLRILEKHMNTTVAVILPQWAVWVLILLCVLSIIEMGVRAVNSVLRGKLERRQMRQNTGVER
jgi:uncharacterized protein HemY